MKISFGHSAKSSAQEIILDTARLINPHIMILGDTGTGKTTFIKRVVYDAVRLDDVVPRVHNFDTQGDIRLPGASRIKFSESTDYGFNPLELSVDPDFGGVRKRIQVFLNALNRTSHKLGPKQEAVLRNLLTDLYAMRGFHLDDPDTWHEDLKAREDMDIPEDRVYVESQYEDRFAVREAGAADWDKQRRAFWFYRDAYVGKATRWPEKRFGKTYPTLQDLVNFSELKLQQIFFGMQQVPMRKLEEFYIASRALHSKKMALMRQAGATDSDLIEKLEKTISKTKEKAIEAFEEHANHTISGHELNNYIKYDSVDVLKSVVDRLKNINAIGIFRSTTPRFDTRNPIWEYEISALGDDEQRLFVEFRLEQLFARALQRGVQKVIRDVFVLDEAHLFISDDKDHIINRVIKMGRKFGVSLVIASQGPHHFSDDLISGVGTKVILGLDKLHFAAAEKKMGIPLNALNFVQARKKIVSLFKFAGEQTQVIWINLDNRPELLN